MADAKEQTVGEEIIEGLRELLETMRKNEPLSAKFTVRTVKLQKLRPLGDEHGD